MPPRQAGSSAGLPRRSAPASRTRLALAAAALVLLASFDLSQPPSHQLGTRVALTGIRAYQNTLSNWMPAAGVVCRFKPTCSHYAAAAFAKHGWLRGAGLTGWRLLRCGPWTKAGTVDEL